MQSIEIDDEVLGVLSAHAQPFVDTPNSTLRRLLGLQRNQSRADASKAAPRSAAVRREASIVPARQKAPKADLKELIARKLIASNERLYLVDFKGERVGNKSAIVDGSDLIHEGKRFSMSALADQLLSKVGYKPGATRGPLHWAKEGGDTITKLWAGVLAEE